MSPEPANRPRILVTFGGRRTLDQWEAYAAAVERAGGEPVALDAHDYTSDLDVRAFDGLLVTGGVDVDPARYGEAPGPETERPSAARDEAEFALTRDALATDVPLFAICRGFQVLNVVAGGTLLQHLEHLEPHRPRQRDDSGVWESGWHDVEVTPGTLLARLTEASTLRVNSRHHQAVTPERLAPGLVADGRTDEGGVAVIEAVEVLGHPFALGVQWHPERAEMQDDAVLEAGAPRLFSAFLDAARVRQGARDGNAHSPTSA